MAPASRRELLRLWELRLSEPKRHAWLDAHEQLWNPAGITLQHRHWMLIVALTTFLTNRVVLEDA